MSLPVPERLLRQVLQRVGGRMDPVGAVPEVLAALRASYERGQQDMRERIAKRYERLGSPSLADQVRSTLVEDVE